jgi:hypothetical protein
MLLHLLRSPIGHLVPAQFPKDVAEPGGVASRMWQALDQPHGDGVADAEDPMGMVEVWRFAATDALEPHGINISAPRRKTSLTA